MCLARRPISASRSRGRRGTCWYVWFDAPIGYVASTAQWCERNGDSLDRWWRSDQTEIHHFIGKDITYFHTLFWPAMLKTAGFSLPKKVHIHGFLTVNGKKMSKRDGTFVLAATYLRHLPTGAYRYYLASKLNPRVDDLDFAVSDFVGKVNSDLVGKVVNLGEPIGQIPRPDGPLREIPCRRRLVSARRLGGGRDRRGLRGMRLRQGHAVDYGVGRSSQLVCRAVGALDTEKGSAAGRAIAGRLHDRDQPVSADRRISFAGLANVEAADGRTTGCCDRALEGFAVALDRRAHSEVPAT